MVDFKIVAHIAKYLRGRYWKKSFFTFLILIFIPFFFLGCGKNELNDKLSYAYTLQSQKDIDSLKAAVSEYEEIIAIALEAVRGSFEAQKLLGIQFALDKNYSMCVKTLQSAVALKTDDDGLYYYLGLCYTHLAKASLENVDREKNIESAKLVFAKGISVNPENSLLHYGKGVLHGFILSEVEIAITSLETARKYNDRDVNILFALANLNYRVNMVEKSADYYREILDIVPEGSDKWNKAKANLADVEGGK